MHCQGSPEGADNLGICQGPLAKGDPHIKQSIHYSNYLKFQNFFPEPQISLGQVTLFVVVDQLKMQYGLL